MQSVTTHLRYLANARRFGVRFIRRRWFELPAQVRIGDRRVAVACPPEAGMKNDFLTCFLADEYGLGRIGGPVRTILDIGANVGFFSMAARARFPAATVHAYEPNPRVLPFLEQHASNCEFEVFGEAVGDRDGFVSMVDSGDSNQAQTAVVDANANATARLIPLGTAVKRLGGRVDVAKIDAEGAEWDMFREVAAWGGFRRVLMEYHLWGRRTYAHVVDALGELGFRIEYHAPSGEWGTVWAVRRQSPGST